MRGKDNNINKCLCVLIPQIVRKRIYEVDIKKLQSVLRQNKKQLKLSNNNIANRLDIPVTQVEHYFRTDHSFAIPEPDIWQDLAKLLGISDSELDKQIMTFKEQIGIYEKRERHYLIEGISPTVTTSDCIRIIV